MAAPVEPPAGRPVGVSRPATLHAEGPASKVARATSSGSVREQLVARMSMPAAVKTEQRQDSPRADLRVDLSRVAAVGSRKQGSSSEEDGRSVADASSKSMSKYQKGMVKAPIEHALQGKNMKDRFTDLKKLRTQAHNAGEEEAYEELDQYINALVAACEIHRERMFELALEVIVVHWETVAGFLKCTPKRPFADLVTRYANEHVDEARGNVEMDKAMARVNLHGVARYESCHKNPHMYCDVFTDDDLQTGAAAAAAFVFLLESRVLGLSVAKGEVTVRSQLVEHAKVIKAEIKKYPESCTKCEPIFGFLKRLDGIIFLFDVMPYSQGTKIADAEFLTECKSSEIYKLLQGVKTTSR